MALREQMEAVDRLMRRPSDLAEVCAGEGDDARVLATVDAARLDATHRCFAELVVARWWRARFPAVLATLVHFQGGAQEAASYLVGHPGFLSAEEEDLRATAMCLAVLDGVLEGSLSEAPEWLPELLAYEYLLSTGLPRRARDEAVDRDLEARLLPNAAWLSGGRLLREVLVTGFSWPVAELQDEPYDAEPDPHTRVLYIDGEEVVDMGAPDLAADVLDLLAGGSADAVISALGEEADDVLDYLRDLGLVKA